MLYMLISLKLLIYGILMFMFSVTLMLNKKMFLIKWTILSLNSCNFEYIIFIDWMNVMFISIVLIISSMVILYSIEYMKNDIKKNYFIYILFLFIVSMILMISSPNMVSIMLGWDGLGLSSYCLIIYYQNASSQNSGMITFLSNRIGDIMLIMMIFMMINLGSWNLFNFKFLNKLFLTLLLLMLMTKSAQIPFSMWLPAAMAAPTPVSSLVHSSTLVTAGIYLMIRFNKLFMINSYIIPCIITIGLFTMFISSLSAMFEYDLKKIIAFSTLSQLGLMMMMMPYNLYYYVFFHLISHAMFKSLLFLCSGMIIHSLNNIQDIRYMGSLIHENPLMMTFFNFANLSLCGFPFLSGYYSKDLLYEMILINKINKFIYMFMYICIMMTIFYTTRLFFYLNFNMNIYYSLSMKIDNFLMNLSMFILFINSILFGNMINWLLFSSINMSIPNVKIKMLMIVIITFSIFFTLMIYNLKLNYFMNLNFSTSQLMQFFMLLKLTLFFNFYLIKMSKMMINYNEISWNEYYSKYMIEFFFKKMFLFLKLNFNNYFIKMIMFFIYLVAMFMISLLFLFKN
uniref:NADH-ubiquinone oxidoreductase chain 5 n=1 Tax=Oberthuerella sharkeyi TaxID=2943459 RepID=A0A9E8G7J9_9HYME|nr:NADH dehydrogenase subunit 5 [Oberthuerella sharkeyi]